MIADIKLVAFREMTEKLRSRGFLIFTGLMAVLLPGAVLAFGLLGSGAQRYEVAVAGQSSSQVSQLSKLVEQRAGMFGAEIAITQQPPQAARQAVRSGEADAAIVSGPRVLAKGDLGAQLETLLQSSAQRLHAMEALRGAGVADGQARAALQPAPLAIVVLGEESADGGKNAAVVSLGAVLLFFALVAYGSWIAMGVVEEKSSRVIEVVISTVRPVRLLTGKVAGIGILALGQLALSVGLALAVAVVMDVTLPPVTFAAAGSVLLWFVLGFAFYCCLFAIAGSLVTKQEDLQYTQLPAMLPIMVGYFLAVGSQTGGVSGALIHALAYVPPFSPMLVPALTASGVMSGWEIAGTAVLTVAAALVLMRAAARIYTGSVLRFGGRVSLREAWS